MIEDITSDVVAGFGYLRRHDVITLGITRMYNGEALSL
jgi:hypothetical protein